ncbi:acyl-coenzyme A thioesterase 13 [Phalacrocorax aristotelis]|uniref:acyl-coenzyme A thioesterase 13 n=1 Tax=Phalacrocorax aristotelis TaxID=126867 RepID=UPI003F4B136E
MGFTVESLREVMKHMVESQGFDRVLRKVKLLSATPGKVVCEMKVEEEHTNRGGTLHGGLTATLVDVVSTTALLYTERAAPGVSVDMNITYTSAAKIGEEILITAQILKQGRNIAFASVDLTNKATGKLIAQGYLCSRAQEVKEIEVRIKTAAPTTINPPPSLEHMSDFDYH